MRIQLFQEVKVAGVAKVSIDFFLNMLGNIELNVNTTNNYPALTSYFTNPSFKKIPFANPPDFIETLMMFP